MLCLLADPTGATCAYAPNPGPWRAFIDLEHSTCYNATNHWSALTDGRTKYVTPRNLPRSPASSLELARSPTISRDPRYVYRAWRGDEQLFNLTADPREAADLAALAAYRDVLVAWRMRMVAQFEAEGRGPDWVHDGRLMVRPKGQTYSPNFPQVRLLELA